MNKLFKNVFYGLTFGLTAVIFIWIFFVKKADIGNPVSYGLILMYVLFILAIACALILSINGLLFKPKSAIMFGLGLGVLVLLIVIGYAIDDHTLQNQYAKYGVTTTTYSGIIGGSLIATWIILGGAVLFALFASISDLIKKL
jgi:hypothetical protein